MNNNDFSNEYKEMLTKKIANYEEIMNEWGTCFFYEKHIKVREGLHTKAMECINKLLSPELKIFLRNLCDNKLGYPDEVIFYKAFGDNPELGRSVSKKELEEKGIDINEFDKYIDYWGLEGNIVGKQNIDGVDYYFLDSLCERADITSAEEYERLNASVALKQAILDKTNMSIEEQDEYIQYIDDLLLGVTPHRRKELVLQRAAKEIINLPDFSKLSSEAQEFFRNKAQK